MTRILLAGLTVVVLAACGSAEQGGADGEDPTTTPDAGTVPRDTTPGSEPAETVPSTDPPVVGEVPEEVMAAVMSDLEDRLDDPGAEVEVTRAESVTWSDGALGCPEPGQMYTQALVDGYHIELEVDGDVFDYRVGSVDNFKLCEQELRPSG